MDKISIHNQLVSSLTNFQQTKGGISNEELSAEVINNACLDILQLRKQEIINQVQEELIINTYIDVAKEKNE